MPSPDRGDIYRVPVETTILRCSMIQTYLKRMPVLAISGAMILIMLLFSLIFNLPIIYPSGERAAFVGIHYIYPLIGVGILGILTFFVGSRAIASRLLLGLPSRS